MCSAGSFVTVHGHSMPVHCNRILPMLRIPNRQNLQPQLYCTEFSVQKIPTVYSNFYFTYECQVYWILLTKS